MRFDRPRPPLPADAREKKREAETRAKTGDLAFADYLTDAGAPPNVVPREASLSLAIGFAAAMFGRGGELPMFPVSDLRPGAEAPAMATARRFAP